ncbi:MAG: serine/threonine-protein kinase [Bacteroidales bacterium]|nr:serine/threonine-protein kinase [Bacteroidales bacterium]
MSEIIRIELSPGTKLCGGKYIIEKKIGAGGFGITYIATHAGLEKKYAIKEFFLGGYNVRSSQSDQIGLHGIDESVFEKFRQRFIDEARTIAELDNDAVVRVLDVFDENGTSYMVMSFVEGSTLQSLVDTGGPLEYEMAVNYIVRVCDALSYIHSKNILHRDVTPDNIIVTPEQTTVLIDFGSARKFIDNRTQRHTTIVKQGYAPLEQYSATSRKGAYTDLYSLGAVFYFILTGQRPIDATERTIERMKEPSELNPDIPAQINAVIMKAMSMNAADRYQSAGEMEEDILSGDFPSCCQDIAAESVQGAPAMPPADADDNNNNDPTEKRIKRKLLYISSAILVCIALIFIVMAIIRRTSVSPEASDSDIPPGLSVEDIFAQAVAMAGSNDTREISEGMLILDSLSDIGFMPAMHEMARTYGWYADSVSLHRKKLLGIEYDNRYIPTDTAISTRALSLLNRISESPDSTLPEIKADAFYRLAYYYWKENPHIRKSDTGLARPFLEKAYVWAKKGNDTILLENIENGLKIKR